ncbi:MAG: 3-dehydroquinate dehydratase [Flavobacteriales bacterium]|nr:3-dehydroquinate dehydratase [Flavobacteriales bacterium]
MHRILILNGPNLDLLGTREPHIYGNRSFEDFLGDLRTAYPEMAFTYAQSNVEGELVAHLRAASQDQDAIILNAAGYSHTSVALRDTIAVLKVPVVEIHISNIHGREDFRHRTLTGAVCAGVITGFGLEGYRLAVDHLLRRAGVRSVR